MTDTDPIRVTIRTDRGRGLLDEYIAWFEAQHFDEGWDAFSSAQALATDVVHIEIEAVEEVRVLLRDVTARLEAALIRERRLYDAAEDVVLQEGRNKAGLGFATVPKAALDRLAAVLTTTPEPDDA